MYKLMIVEDDRGIAEGIEQLVKSWNIEAYVINDFKNLMYEFAEIQPHIVLIDISLPFFNGYHWCNEIRKISKVPIIFISSAADNMNIVMAINMGADDFVAKPFDGEVLVAKVQALLRRTYDFTDTPRLIEHKGVFLNLEDNTVTYEGNKVELTKNEYRILKCLMENKEKVVSREKLMENLWQTDCFIDDNTLTVNVNRVRKKLDSIGILNFISTKIGYGYIIM